MDEKRVAKTADWLELLQAAKRVLLKVEKKVEQMADELAASTGKRKGVIGVEMKVLKKAALRDGNKAETSAAVKDKKTAAELDAQRGEEQDEM